MEKYDKAGYKDPPEAYGAFAFAAMDLILDTIEKVGPDRKKVTAELGKRRRTATPSSARSRSTITARIPCR